MSYGCDWVCKCGGGNLDVRSKCRNCGEPNPSPAPERINPVKPESPAMDERAVEAAARALCHSKQTWGGTAAVTEQYVDTFWRDYLPDAKVAIAAYEASRLASLGAARSAEAVAWRLLQNGEIIEAADQVLADDTVTWLPLKGWEIGLPYYSGVYVPARRAHPNPEAPDV